MNMMDKYAIVKIKGKQHVVAEGQEFLVDKLDSEKIEMDVLLVVDKGKFRLGKPHVKGAILKIKVINKEEKGKKIDIRKFKAKSRYRKRIGFRPVYTRLLVEKIK